MRVGRIELGIQCDFCYFGEEGSICLFRSFFDFGLDFNSLGFSL